MAKKDLVGGALWDRYSQKVSDRIGAPRYMGEIEESEAKDRGGSLIVANWGAEACGDSVRFYWIVESGTEKILKARFKSFGCGTAIAASDMAAELCEGKTVDEALSITNVDVERALRDDPETPAVPPQKMHCSVMASEVIKEAAAAHRGVDKETFDDKDIVCECAQVTRRTIEETIRLNGLTTVDEITNYTKAGAFCKSCLRPGGHEKRSVYLEDILRETLKKGKREDKEDALPDVPAEETPFSTQSLYRKSKMIEALFDQEIRPQLQSDGGDLSITDIREDGSRTIVRIDYRGACRGCPSAAGGTLLMIKNILFERLGPSITVEL